MPDPIEASSAFPFRQVHLDFHNHAALRSLGARFDPDEFGLTLKRAHVASVTCCARCYHGWLYYDSRLFPGRVHPHLVQRDLLEAQIEAGHRHGLRVPVSTSVHWDLESARAHPEWRVVDAAGQPVGPMPEAQSFEHPLCVNTPYRGFLKAHVGELLATLPLDGLVFDGGAVHACSCVHCQAAMVAVGFDPSQAEARLAYARLLRQAFMEDMLRFVRAERPKLAVTFNTAEPVLPMYGALEGLSHVEFDVHPRRPGAGADLGLLARRQRGLGPASVGRTSRFHRGWGDFKGYKSLPALEFDCYRLLSLGCQVKIGDQLLPSGELDQAAYQLIETVYADVSLKEPWCRGARPVVEVAVLDAEALGGTQATIAGCVRLLEEGGYQFDIVDAAADFFPYPVVILPDCITLGEELAAKCEAYLAQGGRLLASFEAGLNLGKTAFRLTALGVKCLGPGPTAPDGLPARGRRFDRCDYADYLLPKGPLSQGLPATALVMYTRALAVAAQPGADVLADVILPVFDRTPEHFCTQQSPPSDEAGGAGIVHNGNTLYFAHKLFELYGYYAPAWVKRLFLNGLARLLSEPVLRHDGPSTLLATVNEQAVDQRWVLHLLHYPPQRRGAELETIEDVIPLHEVKVSLKVPQPVRQVAIRPQHYDTLEFWEADGRLEFVVPKIEGHAMIAVEFA